jgi:hypothetical protein
MLHTFGTEGVEHFSNYTPMLIAQHREKTKRDAKIIAKSRRIRSRGPALPSILAVAEELVKTGNTTITQAEFSKRVRKMQSRGFDKTRRRKVDGTVVKR